MNTTNKTVKAYIVSAKKENQQWSATSGTFAANSEAEAIEKAKSVLNIGEGLNIGTVEVLVHHINTKLSNENYPYGYKRTTAFYNIEVTKNGCRSVFQTIDPKRERLNAPKKSTYSPLLLPIEYIENGHFGSIGCAMNGEKEINKSLVFLNDFKELFEGAMLKQFASELLSYMVVSIKANAIYGGADLEKLKPFYLPKMDILKQIIKGEHTNFLECLLDLSGIEGLKDPNFNPFRVSNTVVIG